MIIWLNGAFGSGKTQTAYELKRRIPGSFVYDPEEFGFCLRKCQPKPLHLPDFQDEPMWRSVNYEMLKQLYDSFDGVIIVPMTVTDKRYFGEIVGRLRGDGCDVRHFVICARRETILRRLRSRGEGTRSWAAQQIPRCLAAFEDPVFEVCLHTDELCVSEVAEKIAGLCGIELTRRDNAFVRFVNRMRTLVGHIR